MELQPDLPGEHWTATGDHPLEAVYKPARGERSLWDFPDGLYRREVAAYALSEALGWGLVPPTVVREDGPLGEGSLQLFVDADYDQHYFTLFDEGGHDDALRTMCAFDVVANNADRKSGHVLQGIRRPAVGHRPRAVLPPPTQAAHGHLGLRRGAGAGRSSDDLERLVPDLPDERGPAAPDRSGQPSWHRVERIWWTRASSPSRSATSRPIRGRWCDPGRRWLPPG